MAALPCLQPLARLLLVCTQARAALSSSASEFHFRSPIVLVSIVQSSGDSMFYESFHIHYKDVIHKPVLQQAAQCSFIVPMQTCNLRCPPQSCPV
mmetsp:Transcript_40021/g.94242  ORF Transcript_40021/g.94242 Transcript_40021/m.94242 type:complete len:95 (-) Transcript_40021:49-333(-)